MDLKNKRILVTGASFIGSHLIPKLVEKEVKSIRVVNLSGKHRSLFAKHLKEIEFITRDLRILTNAVKSVKGMDVVIHLACDHGGRGYIYLFQGATASNFLLDGSVFYACLKQNVEKIYYASSACVYPKYLQNNSAKIILLKESMVKTPYDADNIYGWGKLMGEFTLKTYYKDYGINSVIGRFFTVYGENASESHAVMASIAKAFIKQDPFQVWGDGTQIRNWTYVDDIVEGIILSIEKADKALSINLGSKDKTKVIDMVNLVFKNMKFHPKKIHFLKMPIGPVVRVADHSLASKLLGWKAKYSFSEGLNRTISWYVREKSIIDIKKNLDKLLLGK